MASTLLWWLLFRDLGLEVMIRASIDSAHLDLSA